MVVALMGGFTLLVTIVGAVAGDASKEVPANGEEPKAKPGERLERPGDEIVVCGQLFHTTAPVVLWTDPGGYDAYRVERRFVPFDEASWAKTRDAQIPDIRNPNRYGMRLQGLSQDQVEQMRGGRGGRDTPRGRGHRGGLHPRPPRTPSG